MKISSTKSAIIIFEDFEIEDALRWKRFYENQGYAVSGEFIEPPKGEQGYIELLLSVKYENKK